MVLNPTLSKAIEKPPIPAQRSSKVGCSIEILLAKPQFPLQVGYILIPKLGHQDFSSATVQDLAHAPASTAAASPFQKQGNVQFGSGAYQGKRIRWKFRFLSVFHAVNGCHRFNMRAIVNRLTKSVNSYLIYFFTMLTIVLNLLR